MDDLSDHNVLIYDLLESNDHNRRGNDLGFESDNKIFIDYKKLSQKLSTITLDYSSNKFKDIYCDFIKKVTVVVKVF